MSTPEMRLCEHIVDMDWWHIQSSKLTEIHGMQCICYNHVGLNRDNGWQFPEFWNATLRADMMSSRDTHHPEQSVDGEAQAMEMDS